MSSEDRRSHLAEQIITVPNLRLLGVHPDQQHADSGSGTTVYKVGLIPTALKVFGLPGYKLPTLHDVRNYRHTTNDLQKEVQCYPHHLTQKKHQDFIFKWTINPIAAVGLVRLDTKKVVPYTLSPWITGVSLGDLFSHSTKVSSIFADLQNESTLGFLRAEFARFNKLLRFNHPYPIGTTNLLALNVLVRRAQKDNHFDLVITNIREFIDRHQTHHHLGQIQTEI